MIFIGRVHLPPTLPPLLPRNAEESALFDAVAGDRDDESAKIRLEEFLRTSMTSPRVDWGQEEKDTSFAAAWLWGFLTWL